MRNWSGDGEKALDALPPLIRWRLRRPLRPEETRDCFSRIGDYAKISMGFRNGTSPVDLVTSVQVVPPPRMRITSFGSAEDDLTFFLREVLKANRHLEVASDKLSLAMSRGITDPQKAAAREILSLSRTDGPEGREDDSAGGRGGHVCSRRASSPDIRALLRCSHGPEAACSREIREEEMLWKVLVCRVSDIINPDATTKVEIPKGEVPGGDQHEVEEEPPRSAQAHERQAGKVPEDHPREAGERFCPVGHRPRSPGV